MPAAIFYVPTVTLPESGFERTLGKHPVLSSLLRDLSSQGYVKVFIRTEKNGRTTARANYEYRVPKSGVGKWVRTKV